MLNSEKNHFPKLGHIRILLMMRRAPCIHFLFLILPLTHYLIERIVESDAKGFHVRWYFVAQAHTEIVELCVNVALGIQDAKGIYDAVTKEGGGSVLVLVLEEFAHIEDNVVVPGTQGN